MGWFPSPELKKLVEIAVIETVMSFNDQWEQATKRAQADAAKRNVSYPALAASAAPEIFKQTAERLVTDLLEALRSADQLNAESAAWAKERVFATLKNLGVSRAKALAEDATHRGRPGSFSSLEREAPRAATRASMKIDRAVALAGVQQSTTPQGEGLLPPQEPTDAKRVAVVHGRNHAARDGMFDFLRALSLDPIAWDEAIHAVKKGTAHPSEILGALFGTTQAVVVLLTGDEDASLLPTLRRDAADSESKRQARPNVWIEAGMALGVRTDRTILVRFGDHDQPSDLHGLDYIDFDASPRARERLKSRLELIGCDVITRSGDWMRAGDSSFAKAVELSAIPAVPVPAAASPVPKFTDPACPNCSTNSKIVYMSRLPPVMVRTFRATHHCTQCNYRANENR